MDGQNTHRSRRKIWTETGKYWNRKNYLCVFFPDGKHILYASTHLVNNDCPPIPDRSKYSNKYIWAVYEGFDIFKADTSGKIIQRLTTTNGLDAEATISPKGDKFYLLPWGM